MLFFFQLSAVADVADVELSSTRISFLVIASSAIWTTFNSNIQAVVDFVVDQLLLQKKTYEVTRYRYGIVCFFTGVYSMTQEAAEALWREAISFWTMTRSDSPEDAVVALLPLNPPSTSSITSPQFWHEESPITTPVAES